MLAYLSRYTHRVAISNRRLVSMDERSVTFRWKDYRAKYAMHKTMTLDAGEFMRRFLLHVLPTGFHRIRHYGIFANGGRTVNLALARALLHLPAPVAEAQNNEPIAPTFICRHCGAPMVITAIFFPIHPLHAPPRHQGAPP